MSILLNTVKSLIGETSNMRIKIEYLIARKRCNDYVEIYYQEVLRQNSNSLYVDVDDVN